MAKVLPDFNKLRLSNLSTDKTRIKPKESQICWKEFLTANFNFVNECSFAISEEEVADITMSLQNWVSKRNISRYTKRNTQGSFIEQSVNIGDIYLIDFGLNYEKGYCRTAVVIHNIDNMILVVPTTTQSSIFNNAYHPIENKTGNRMYRRMYSSNGFDQDCVLLFSNTRIVSKGRIIDGNNKLKNYYENENVYDEIMFLLFENLLPDIYNNYISMNNKIKKLNRRIEELEEFIQKN